jgi:hypothetical protein
MTAAGMSRLSHFDPPYRAAIPRKIRTTVQPIDFFEFALMCRNLLRFDVSEFQGFKVSKSAKFKVRGLSIYFETLKP